MRTHLTAPRAFSASFLLATATVLASACSAETRAVYLGRESNPPSFVSPDASDDAAGDASVPNALTNYCPSNKCPAGWTTCPDSRFPCDVNLNADRDNCGACGAECPPIFGSMHECIEGRCVMQCSSSSFDCDGLPDNGCEASAASNDSCNGCGVKCLDPAKPCVDRSMNSTDYGCGCHGDDLLCIEEQGIPRCRDGTKDDNNCGACGNVCDPAGSGGPIHPNTYRGCVESECDRPKCLFGYANCDADISNGCETDIHSAQHCGACNKACPTGQDCKLDEFGTPKCMCPPGQTYCPIICFNGLCTGECRDLATDAQHCGACGRACATGGTFLQATCTYGTCKTECAVGRADCNGDPSDGCEVNANSDPNNCGGCGRVCDAIAGQACVGGQCVVEPCDEEPESDGGIAK